MPVHACVRILFYNVLQFCIEAWLNIHYSIKYQYELAVQYQYHYGLILILNMNKNTALLPLKLISLLIAPCLILLQSRFLFIILNTPFTQYSSGQGSKSYIYIHKLMNIHLFIRFNIVSISLRNDKHITINE